jgi:hypothetical protein
MRADYVGVDLFILLVATVTWLSQEPGGRSVQVAEVFWIASEVALVVTLLGSISLVAAGMVNEPEWILAKWDLLGACARVDPPYSAVSIWLNRSVHRKLLRCADDWNAVLATDFGRGEARWITIFRAALITCVGCGVAVAAIYLLVSLPVGSAPYTLTLVDRWQPPVPLGRPDPLQLTNATLAVVRSPILSLRPWSTY